MTGICKKLLSGVLMVTLLFDGIMFPINVFAENESVSIKNDILYDGDQIKYSEYIASQPEDSSDLTRSLDVPLFENYQTKDMEVTVCENYQGSGRKVIETADSGNISFAVSVPIAGRYGIRVTYYPMIGSGSSAMREILLDGKVPFYESSVVEFSRLWGNKKSNITTDNIGNDIMPMQEETPRFETTDISDRSGISNETLYYYLTAGNHILTLNSVREPLALASIQFFQNKELYSYNEVWADYQKRGYSAKNSIITIQGEDASIKSDATMYPLSDKTSPLTQPSSYRFVKYNTIGGSKWQQPGQWLEWNIPVKEDGLYTISMRFRQSLKNNSVVYRKLYIDGQIPFKEAESVEFPYASGFQAITLGEGDEKWQFYLTAGNHTLRLEANTGKFIEVLEKTQKIVMELNEVYRVILMITGPSPDQYRDYDFTAMIPDALKQMTDISNKLITIQEEIKTITSWENGQEISILQRVIRNLQDMVADDTTIAARFKNFQDNISSLAAWVLSAKNQPLEIDYFIVNGKNSNNVNANSTIWSSILFQLQQLVSSFVIDYNQLGDTSKGESSLTTVWIQTGRDQTQIIRQLINEDFTPNSNIQVNLQLVAMGSLLPAIIAGQGPDCALQLGQGEPMNYAFRNAVENLSEYSEIKEVSERFSKNAMIPFTYKDKIYALPETQSFQMLFYRKDIIYQLGLKKENLQTWDDIFKTVIPELQKNYLSFGMLPTLTNYALLLNQRGGSIYDDNGINTLLNSLEALSTFKIFSNLYMDYKLPISFDFANRFRSGEMPIAVMDFSAYNQLSVFAPEIQGLWDMLPVPATRRDDGTLNQSSILSVTGCVMFSSAKNKDATWDFMKWWTTAPTQKSYGKNMESIMGTAARYNSANTEAFEAIPWTRSIGKAIKEQQLNAIAIPEVPGGYYTSRYYDFAFRDIVYNGEDVRETLDSSVQLINAEIRNKREEFKLD